MPDSNRAKDRGTGIEDRIVWLSIAIYIWCFGYISFLKYQSFGYQDFDLAVYSQALWNILHGSINSSILGIDFLGNHAGFIVFLIAPAYVIFKSPLTLLFIQSIALAIAAFPIYLIAKKELDKSIGLAVVFIYLVYPALGYLNLFEFHPQVLAVPFLAFMYYYFEMKDFKMFVIFMALSLMCQENISLIIISFGIYAFFIKKGKKWPWAALLCGMIWFYIAVFKVMPYFNKDTIQFISIYRHLGSSIPEILRSIILHPAKIIKAMFAGQKIIYLFKIFFPVSFLPLFDLRILITAPLFAQHLLSSRQSECDIRYHYAAELLPFIFISMIYGLKNIVKSGYLKAKAARYLFISFLLLIGVASNIYMGPQSGLSAYAMAYKRDVWDREKQGFINLVPGAAAVVSTFEFLPKLSLREHLYSFHHVVKGSYTLSSRAYILPEGAEYALLDFNDLLTFGAFYIRGRSEINLREFIARDKWGVVDMAGSIALLKKNHKSGDTLYRVFDKMPEISNIRPVNIGDSLEFLGYDSAVYKNSAEGIKIKMTLYWSVSNKVKEDYGNFIDILDQHGDVRYRFWKPICYRIYPTYLWKEREVVSEDYVLLIPEDIGPGYSVKMGAFDHRTGVSCAMHSKARDLVYRGNMINLIDKTSIER